jgi:uncharacterized protein (DUF1684 family)
MRQLLKSASIAGTAIAMGWCSLASASDPTAVRADVEQWQARRLASLTSDTGWLTLAGLFWLGEGENGFGSAASNSIRLANPGLAANAGSFVKSGNTVRFVARAGSGITHDGKAITTLDLVPDSRGEPTVLASGPVSFFVIERGGKYGVRVRDLANPHLTDFSGLQYFPISTDWAFDARFEPYEPRKHIPITNILGMEENMDSPGALVFTKDGRKWRLDAILEEPDAKELFVMFADATSGKETYGAGRFMYLPLPQNGTVRLDFNKSYNPPCAFNDFATCPLPPSQNRLGLRVEAGEKSYTGGHQTQ